MAINRRRAPSSKISREKKLLGHANENEYSQLINGKTIAGTKKSDVIDKHGFSHSVKSGKKWQIFLYGYDRISNSEHLKLLKPCLEAFPENADDYFTDREKCIEFKENYIKVNGRAKAKQLTNSEIEKNLASNKYINSKKKLAESTSQVCIALEDKENLRNFLAEALFNIDEVKFLVIREAGETKNNPYNVFLKEDVLDILTEKLFPAVSKAGLTPEDFNVAGQKTLLCYLNSKGKPKNLVEIEIRNDSKTHYKQVRFNMYSKDALSIFLTGLCHQPVKKVNSRVWIHGSAQKLI